MISQDCRTTVVQHSHDIRTSVAKISHCKFAKISQRQVCDTRTNVVRQSCEIFWRKQSHKIFKHVQNLRECRAKIRDKIRKTVARNSHASEILAEDLNIRLKEENN